MEKSERDEHAKFGLYTFVVVMLAASLLPICSSDSTPRPKRPHPHAAEISSVKRLIDWDAVERLTPSGIGLSTRKNERGEGVFVYVERTRFLRGEQNLFWLVINDRVFTFNGSSKNITPGAKWSRDMSDSYWRKTGWAKSPQGPIGYLWHQ